MQPNGRKPAGGAILPPGEAGERDIKVLVVGADPALEELLAEWLDAEGCRMVDERPDLVLVDLPFPRSRGLEALQRLSELYPDRSIVPMPKPLTREAFVAALRRALDEVR